MSGQRLECPECGTSLRLKRVFGPRETIHCPKCDTRFQARMAEGYRAASESESSRSRAARKPDRSRRDEDEDEDEEDDRPRRRKKEAASGNTGLIVGVAVGGVALAVVTGLAVWLMTSGGGNRGGDQQASTNPVLQQPMPVPTPNPNPFPVQPVNNPPQPQPPTPMPQPQPPQVLPAGPQPGPSATSGALERTVLDRVKKATVYIRVTRPDGLSSGSGFLEEGSKMVMTNAHVLGMLTPTAAPPRKIELIFNSGLPNEQIYDGVIVGVDRQSDLAIVRMGDYRPGDPLPEPLKVVTARGLFETQRVYIFGFPFGEKVGKNITVSESSISSLRTGAGGHVEKVQVNGGMQPGNSGGPVVDDKGNVVGVAVSIITATNLNFAIPGESVHSLLRGRVSGLAVGEAIRKGANVAVPITVEMINPLAQIRNIEIEWWFAPAGQRYDPTEGVPGNRPATAQTVSATFSPGGSQATAELLLPGVPPTGEQLYVRPVVTSEGAAKKYLMAIGNVVKTPPESKPSTVVVRFSPARNLIKLKSEFTMRIDLDEERAGDLRVNVESTLQEAVQPMGFNGGNLSYKVGRFEVGLSLDKKAPKVSPRFQAAIRQMSKLNLGLRMDMKNNITNTVVEANQAGPEYQDALEAMGQQMMQSLEIVTIPMPHNGKFDPGLTWQGSRKVSLGAMDMLDLLDKQTGQLDITYTYRGVRTVGNRDLPVVGLRGRLRGLQGGSTLRLGGDIVGEVAIDPNTGRAASGLVTMQIVSQVKIRGGGSLQTTGKLVVKIER